MDLSSFIRPESLLGDLAVANKKQVLRAVAKHAATISGLSEAAIFELLLRRENLGSTGIGGGIAIPHAKLPGISSIFATFVRITRPVDFEAQDSQPVDLVIALFAPEGAGADHLKALAKIARSFGDEQFVERLRQCTDEKALFGILTHQEADAA